MVVDIESDEECPELVETDEPSHMDANGDKKVRGNSTTFIFLLKRF